MFRHLIRPLGRTSRDATWLCIALYSAAAASATTVVYDDFDRPSAAQVYVIGAQSANPTLLQQSATEIMGGQRDMWVRVTGQPQSFSALGTVGDGLLVFGSSVPGAVAKLQYDGIDLELGPNLTNSLGLHSDMTSGRTQSGFLFNFQALDSGPTANALEVAIDVRGPSGNASYSGLIPDSGTPFPHYIRFGNFTTAGSFSFDDVTSVEVTFNPLARQDVDFELDSFGTNVPEPATAGLSLLALALVAFMMRWRKG